MLDTTASGSSDARPRDRRLDPNANAAGNQNRIPLDQPDRGRHAAAERHRDAAPPPASEKKRMPQAKRFTPDWRNFDAGKAVRILRTAREGDAVLPLRKLHCRWWHASANQMKRLLDRVGVPTNIMDLIPRVVAQCTVCRAWQSPENANQLAIDIPDNFNQTVECDIMFSGDIMVFHMIDSCTRWHEARVVLAKPTKSL